MLQFMMSGKIVSVNAGFNPDDAGKAVVIDFEQKSFKDGKLSVFRWQLFAGAHKAKWAKTLMDKGYSVVVVIDDLLFFDERIRDDKTKFSGYGHISEILTL